MSRLKVRSRSPSSGVCNVCRVSNAVAPEGQQTDLTVCSPEPVLLQPRQLEMDAAVLLPRPEA